MRSYQKIFCMAGVSLLLTGTTLLAADLSAKDVVSKSFQYLGALDKYAFNAVVTDYARHEGDAKIYKKNVSVKMDRPDRLRVDVKADDRDRTTYINNGLFTMVDHGFGYYGQLKTPKTIDGTLDLIFDKYGIKAPLASLIYSDMSKRAKLKRSKYFGIVDVDGVKCHYVAFKDSDKEVHVWIETGDKPLVKTYTVIDTTLESHPRTDTTLAWINDPKISDSDFVFKAPKGASKISIQSAN